MVSRGEPYKANGAPKSPRVLAYGGALLTLLTLLLVALKSRILVSYPSLAGVLELLDPADVALLGLTAAFGFYQDRGARKEQAAGVPELKAERDAMPPGVLDDPPADEVLGDEPR